MTHVKFNLISNSSALILLEFEFEPAEIYSDPHHSPGQEGRGSLNALSPASTQSPYLIQGMN